MKVINDIDTLNQAIRLLQLKRDEELRLFREELKLTQESLNPVNLIKSSLQEITSSPDIKNNLINVGIGLTTGYLSRKALFGVSRNPVKKVLGVLLQFAVTNMVSKHTEGIKSIGQNLLQRFWKRRNRSISEFHHNGNV